MAERNLIVVFTLFPGGLALDFMGPHMVFSRLPGARVLLASTMGGEIQGEGGITIGGLHRLSDIAACDIVCVPGGRGIDDAILDEAFLSEVRRLAGSARFITSVCTGALGLGAAGLLRGKRALLPTGMRESSWLPSARQPSPDAWFTTRMSSPVAA